MKQINLSTGYTYFEYDCGPGSFFVPTDGWFVKNCCWINWFPSLNGKWKSQKAYPRNAFDTVKNINRTNQI